MTLTMTPKKNILLCFDAFGTLFRPRQSIIKQYGDVARSYGVSGFDDDELAASFKNAFKTESKDHPNYGRATNMGSQQWWTNVIERTFLPVTTKHSQRLPPAVAPALLHRFNSKEGYEMFPDAIDYIKALTRPEWQHILRRNDVRSDDMSERRLVVGLITNSDDRVPDVLSSFGLTVKPLRHGTKIETYHPSTITADIDFAIMSYDVGHEKPDRRIFDAASSTVRDMLVAEGEKQPDLSDWCLIYVGDELEKDAFAAADAGWRAILLDRDGLFEAEASEANSAPHAGDESFQLSDATRSVTVVRSFAGLWNLTHH